MGKWPIMRAAPVAALFATFSLGACASTSGFSLPDLGGASQNAASEGETGGASIPASAPTDVAVNLPPPSSPPVTPSVTPPVAPPDAPAETIGLLASTIDKTTDTAGGWVSGVGYAVDALGNVVGRGGEPLGGPLEAILARSGGVLETTGQGVQMLGARAEEGLEQAPAIAWAMANLDGAAGAVATGSVAGLAQGSASAPLAVHLLTGEPSAGTLATANLLSAPSTSGVANVGVLSGGDLLSLNVNVPGGLQIASNPTNGVLLSGAGLPVNGTVPTPTPSGLLGALPLGDVTVGGVVSQVTATVPIVPAVTGGLGGLLGH